MGIPDVGLRPVQRADLELLTRFLTEPDLIGPDWNGFKNPQVLVERFDKDRFLGDDGGWLMVDADGTTAGFVIWRSVVHVRERCWNIGISLLPEHRRRGIGARAQRDLTEYLLRHTPVQRIEAGTQVDNIAEQRALERAGFTREGVVRGIQFNSGIWRDGVLYSRLRTDTT